MFDKKTFYITAALCFSITLIAFLVAFFGFYGGGPSKPFDKTQQAQEQESAIKDEDTAKSQLPANNTEEKEQETALASSAEEKITPSTKMTYEYYYPEDGITQIQEEEPPYFLLDLTLSDLLKYYPNWTVVSFSSREVVMRKEVDGQSNEHYIVGQQDGYIAVFYQKEQNGISLHTLTDTPVSTLSHAEQVRLSDGIEVVGEENLAKILEDYES